MKMSIYNVDGELRKGEIEKCICKLKNNKTGGSDGLVGELLKYGGVVNGESKLKLK